MYLMKLLSPLAAMMELIARMTMILSAQCSARVKQSRGRYHYCRCNHSTSLQSRSAAFSLERERGFSSQQAYCTYVGISRLNGGNYHPIHSLLMTKQKSKPSRHHQILKSSDSDVCVLIYRESQQRKAEAAAAAAAAAAAQREKTSEDTSLESKAKEHIGGT